MSNKLQQRLKEIAKECGGNRALCEKSGVSERTFANWLAGSSEPKIIGISAIANAANVTIDWVVTGANPKQRLGSREGNTQDVIHIPLIDQDLEENDNPIIERMNIRGHIPFSKDFLENRLKQQDLNQLCVLEVSGDSMNPTMDDGDFVLVNRSHAKAQDGLSAFIFKDSVFIKRVLNIPNGIDVISDNKDLYPLQRIEGPDQEHLEFIGQVIWIGKTVL